MGDRRSFRKCDFLWLRKISKQSCSEELGGRVIGKRTKKMEREFQTALLRGCEAHEGFAYHIPDVINSGPFHGKNFQSGGKKPFDVFWVTPYFFCAMELKQLRQRLSFNICKETDSCSLKQHQYECLKVIADCGHVALAVINFKFKPSAQFKKKYPQFIKPTLDMAYAVPIEHLVAEYEAGVEQLPIDWFWNKGYDLIKKSATVWDPATIIASYSK